MDPDRTLKARRPRSLIVKLQGGRGATLNNTEVEPKNIYHFCVWCKWFLTNHFPFPPFTFCTEYLCAHVKTQHL